MIYWFLIGLAVTLYILYGRKKSDEAKEITERIRLAFGNDGSYYAIKIPAGIFWIGVFSLLWPLIIYIEFFFKKNESE